MTQTPPDDTSGQPRSRREAREAERAGAAARATTEPATPSNEEHPFARLGETGGTGEAGGTGESPTLAWRQQQYPSRQKPPKRRRSLKGLWVTLIIVAILGGLGATAYSIFQPQIAKLVAAAEPNDYTGNGSSQVVVTIKSGDIGSDVATTLNKAGVTKTYEAFYKLLLSTKPSPVFQPGSYKLAKKMSAASALAALEDPKNKVQLTAAIPEGTAEKDVLSILAAATKLPLADLTAAARNVSAYGVPPEAKTLEGFLFPATYTFTPGVTASEVIKTLVDRSLQALDDAGVPAAARWKTVVLASIVQKEAGPEASDFGKIARVFLNRIAQGMPLQSDATVSYGAGSTGKVQTTPAQRADASNLYNTYAHTGLPVGPISNPGDVAIKAALSPTPGSWLYFVAVNLQTGKTVFSTTFADHEAAVQQLDDWCKASPENNALCQ